MTKTIEAVERLLARKQGVPSQLIRNLIIDCKSFQALLAVRQAEIDALKSKLAELEEAAKVTA